MLGETNFFGGQYPSASRECMGMGYVDEDEEFECITRYIQRARSDIRDIAAKASRI